MLAELFNSEVKLLTMPSSERSTLENRGMTLYGLYHIILLFILLISMVSFMTQFLPSLCWAEERSLYPTFTSVLKMLGKLFRKYHTDPPVSANSNVITDIVSMTKRVSKHGM